MGYILIYIYSYFVAVFDCVSAVSDRCISERIVRVSLDLHDIIEDCSSSILRISIIF